MSGFGGLLVMIGILLFCGLPKTDRRFKTGFRNNVEPKDWHVKSIVAFFALGIIFMCLGSIFRTGQSEQNRAVKKTGQEASTTGLETSQSGQKKSGRK
jgi:hypothetical protein